ncbi:MAG TPA: peptidase [Acidobacteriaceae bacterium]|jgi:putative proteasome-type protease|nr:peptidase [Acidobacteriaceae bacterium]
MTYCLGIMTQEGLVMASDSRTNAGFDDLNIARKMHTFSLPGERVFVVLSSGSLSLSQSIISLAREAFAAGEGLARVRSMYDAARELGECVRQVAELDRAALERDNYSFNVHLLLGGQVRGQEPCLFMIYPQGNPISATEESPFLQLGEYKYGRPLLDRGIVFRSTSLMVAAKYALLSFDATMRSNGAIGPPIELLVYRKDSLVLDCYRKFGQADPELQVIHARWEQSLRRAVEDLPDLNFVNPPVEEPEQNLFTPTLSS